MTELPQLGQIWVYLAASPLLGLTMTLLAYVLAQAIYLRCGASPLANPVAIAVALVCAMLALSGMPYRDYFEGAQFVHFLLGPATVALAVPLARQWPQMRRWLLPMLAALLAGSVTAIVSAVGVMLALGGNLQLAASAGPKSATTPIAMALSQKLGGVPSLTAMMVIGTGILGAIVAPFVFARVRGAGDEVRGFALGVAAHGIGTARAFQLSAARGAFAGFGMGLNGVLTALLAPWLVPVLLRLA
ncbi:MAG TPA: LrgB family protein [Telluria sp.]|jgi:predicted murein hydrolase (TIGR00659 family)